MYEVSVTGTSAVHFDLYDSVTAANHAKSAPFSHDGDRNGMPEPAPVALRVLGILSLAAGRTWRSARLLKAKPSEDLG